MSWRGNFEFRLRGSGGALPRSFRSPVTLILGCAVLLTTPVANAPGADQAQTRDTPARADTSLTVAQPSEVTTPTRGVPPDRQLSVESSELSRFGFSREAIDEGRVVAIRPGESEVVSAAGLSSSIDSETIFVERVRPVARPAAAPAALAAREDQGAVTDYKLGFEVTAFDAESSRPLKLDAWARDSTGLVLHGSSATYVGQFHVALTLADNPSDSSTLAAPVNVAVAAPGASIEPRPLAIGQLGRWHDVSITVPGVDAERYEISVSADPTVQGDPYPCR